MYCALAAWRPGSVTVNHLDLIKKKNQGKICASALQNRCTTDYANTNVFKWVITQRCAKTSLGPPLDTTEHCPRHTIREGNWRVIMGAYEYDKPRLRVQESGTKVLQLVLWSFQSVFAEARWHWTRLGESRPSRCATRTWSFFWMSCPEHSGVSVWKYQRKAAVYWLPL